MLAAVLWQSLDRWPVAVALVAIVAGLTWVFYLPQLQLIGQGWRWLLVGLRTAALTCLAISVLRPVLIRAKSVEEQGAVVIVIDDSMSMSVVDSQRGIPGRVALAGALGALPDRRVSEKGVEISSQLEQALSKLEQVGRLSSDLDYARLVGRGVDEARDRLATARNELKQRLDELVTKSNSLTMLANIPEPKRFDEWVRDVRQRILRAQQVSAQLQNELDYQAYKNNPSVRKSSDLIATMTRFELAQRAILESGVGLLDRLPKETPVIGMSVGGSRTTFPLRTETGKIEYLPMSPKESESNLLSAVRAAREKVRGPVRAIVLLSDGRQVTTGPPEPLDVAAGVPVIAVNVASRNASSDLSIHHVAVATSAFVGETISVRASLRHVGFHKGTANVECRVGTLSEKKTINLNEERETPLEFSFKLEKAGLENVSVEVTAMQGEASLENNRAERWIKVIDDKIRVGLFTGNAGWDFQYIRNAFTRTPWITTRSEIVESAGVKIDLAVEELGKLDVVILSDLAVGALSDEQWDAIKKMVIERGGSVMLVAGETHTPAEYLGVERVEEFLPGKSLKSPAWRVWPGEAPGLRLTPTPFGLKGDALRLADDADASRRRWMELSPVYRCLQWSELKPNVNVLISEAESGLPVLTEARLGAGRAFFFGVTETWRWRYQVGERDQDRFWLQLVRYAAEEPYSLTNENFSLDVERGAVEVGQPIKVRAKATQGDVDIHVVSAGSVVRVERLKPGEGAAKDRYEATLEGLPVGDYEVRLKDSNSPGVPFHVIRSTENEMMNLAGDEATLQKLADSTGGEMLRLEQIATLPDRLNAVQSEQSKLAERSLWDGPWLYGFVLGCLAMEWAVRKRQGLV